MPRFPIFITVLAIVALVTLRAGDAGAWESTRRVPPPYDDSKPPPDEQLRSLLPATQQQQQETSSKKTDAPATKSVPPKPLPSEAKPEAADTATAAPAAAAAPAPSSTSSASEQALGDSFRAALQEFMDRYEGATEQDGKFEELFPHNSLSVTRIQHARIHKSYTTCIDTQIKLMSLALGKTNLELVSKINSDLSERYKREKLQLPLGAWNEVVHELLPSVYPRGRWVTDPVKNKWSAFTPNPNTTYVDPRLPGSPRPQKGDVYVFIFDTEVLDPVTKKVKNSAGSFSHMGFVSSVKPAAAGSTVETWLTYDGGAGSAPKYDITKIGAVDEAIKPEWYLWGKEKIVTNHRRFDTSRNKFLEGVAGQEGEGRALLGWISMDKMVRPISPKPEPSTGKVPPKPKGVAAIAKLAKGKSLDPSASAPPSAPSATPSAALPAQ